MLVNTIFSKTGLENPTNMQTSYWENDAPFFDIVSKYW